MTAKYNNFFTRVQDCKQLNKGPYTYSISTRVNASPADQLFKDCFAQHVGFVDPNITSLIYNTGAKNKYITSDNLSAYFVNKFYEIPRIFHVSDTLRRNEVEFSNFIDKFIENPNTRMTDNSFILGSNRLRYIVGDIGEGKSSFIKKIISVILDKKKEYKTPFPFLILYIDVEYLYVLNNKEPESLNPIFLSNLFNLILLEVEKQLPQIDIEIFNAINSSNIPTNSLISILQYLFSQNIRPLIFIDNIDCYHSYYARYSFFKEFKQKQVSSIEDNVLWLIRILSPGGSFGTSGLNIMFAFRKYIFEKIEFLKKKTSTSPDNAQCFTLETPDEERVIMTRLFLLSDALKLVEEKQPKVVGDMQQLYPTWYDMIIKTFNFRENSTIKDIYKLGQHGHRSLVKFLSSLNFPYHDQVLFQRFFRQQVSTMYILYFNDMKKKYTQKQNHFPNMFLNDCTLYDTQSFKKAHAGHMHSYWLKYFMLKILVSEEEMRFSELYDIFSTVGGYEDHLVRHVLGSLCTADEFRCAEIKDGEESKPFEARIIRPTERGKMLYSQSQYKTELCLGFEYLCTIIDDLWLSFPKPYFNELFDSNFHLNYSILYETNNKKYAEDSTALMLKKSYNVLTFISCLSVSYEAEIQSRKTMLHSLLKKQELIPDFEYLGLRVVKSVGHLLKSLTSEIKHDKELSEIEKYRQKLLAEQGERKKFFTKYYKSQVQVEI